MSLSTARAAYMSTAVTTANPSSLLVMLLDRLVLDVVQAQDAATGAQPLEMRRHLVHAQEIVMELRGTLDTDGFVGAVELGALYDYLLRRLINASVTQDADALVECRALSTGLADTWRQAAMITSAP